MKLDDKGFVYKTTDGKIWFIKLNSEGVPWVHYWHPDNRWVTLRQVNQSEIFLAYQSKISEQEAEELHKQAFR
jgi:hypothetical protein